MDGTPRGRSDEEWDALTAKIVLSVLLVGVLFITRGLVVNVTAGRWGWTVFFAVGLLASLLSLPRYWRLVRQSRD
ncbi:hypothetical protein ASF35_06830 [Aeromicrobium sp. Leaf291]|nr:hypothetical protein ASF35_06830 [Aeromicrobium sp. Leaf291]